MVLRLDNRENARIVEMCYKNHTTLINPIIDWTTDEVWEFIREYNVPYCSLYDEGFKRLGCIGCPMASKQMREYEFERWPKYKNLSMISFQKMIENRGGGDTIRPQKKCGTGGSNDSTDSRGSVDWLDEWPMEGEPKTGQFADMTPEEIMNWWID